MHFMVSWNIRPPNPRIPLPIPPFSSTPPAVDDREQIDNSFKQCFKNYSWVGPLASCIYIVRIENPADWNLIRDNLVEVCKKNRGRVNLIMSPVMDGGYYAGWLPKNLWPRIRELTE
jgi:hypothetical protein